MPLHIDFIIKKIRPVIAKVDPAFIDIAMDKYVDLVGSLNDGKYKTAYFAALQLYRLSNTPVQELVSLFHDLVFAEDVVTADSIVFIHEKSPFNESFLELASELKFLVQEHKLLKSYWTKDYMISLGDQLIVPVKEESETYLTDEHIGEATTNERLYYGPLKIMEHHQAKANITSEDKWAESANSVLIQSNFVHKSLIEGGNFFCAVNQFGNRFYLLGENVVSETMAYNHIPRIKAIELIREELGCSNKSLLIIPQWTYHLDLQMAYLGRGQFVIHSFKQQDFNFGLSATEIKQCRETFNFLEQQFEVNIIDAAIKILRDNGFEVSKVFGCLFFLEDITDPNQLRYVPYCKSSDGFDGALASMMNGIALDLGERGRHFLVALCDLSPFRRQYEESLKKINIKLHDVDMLGAYSYTGFESMSLGILSASNITQVSAFMNGALRCQTSIVSKTLCKGYSLELSRHQFFKSVDHLSIDQGVDHVNSEYDEAGKEKTSVQLMRSGIKVC